MSFTQRGKLYPTVPSSVSSANFDVVLLYALLRNICALTPPRTGSDSLSLNLDFSKDTNIVRLKYFNDDVYSHANQASVDDVTFNIYWQDINAAKVVLGGFGYRSAIGKLKNKYMDPLMEVKVKEMMGEIQARDMTSQHRTPAEVGHYL